MGIDTKIILLRCIVTEILTKEGFFVMAALICTLGELPKDDRVASFRFLKSTPRRYGNSKKTIARFSKNLEFGNRTITFGVRHNFCANWRQHVQA